MIEGGDSVRRKRKMDKGEIIFGLIIIALIVYMLIDTSISGRGSDGADFW